MSMARRDRSLKAQARRDKRLAEDGSAEVVDEETLSKDVGRIAQQMRAQITPQVRDQVLVSTLFAQRDFPARDVVRYVQFAESPAARWFYGTLGEALHASMVASAEDLGSELAAMDLEPPTLEGVAPGSGSSPGS